jgi:hypothetical protein
MRRRHKIVMSAVAAVVPLAGWFAFVPAAAAGVPPYNNSQDSVVCTTVTKGIIKASPPLNFVGGMGATLSISGTLGGCSSPSHPTLVFPEGKSKFKGTITSTTNNCTSLAGATTGTGTITFTWSATDTGGAGLAQKTSTLSLPTGGAVGGTFTSPTQPAAGYGQFVVGTANGVAMAPAVSGGFQGGDAGATSTATVVTSQSIVTAAAACASTKGLKQLNIGTGAIELQ